MWRHPCVNGRTRAADAGDLLMIDCFVSARPTVSFSGDFCFSHYSTQNLIVTALSGAGPLERQLVKILAGEGLLGLEREPVPRFVR